MCQIGVSPGEQVCLLLVGCLFMAGGSRHPGDAAAEIQAAQGSPTLSPSSAQAPSRHRRAPLRQRLRGVVLYLSQCLKVLMRKQNHLEQIKSVVVYELEFGGV